VKTRRADNWSGFLQNEELVIIMDNAALSELQAMNRATVLHPFTVAGEYEAGVIEPFDVETGKDVRPTGMDDTSLMYALGGLYCMNIGYGRSEVAYAISAHCKSASSHE
jgi:adenosylmethionine-8-amino-7-oxononanoate aminotransferase